MDRPVTVRRRWLLLKGQHDVIEQAQGAAKTGKKRVGGYEGTRLGHVQ